MFTNCALSPQVLGEAEEKLLKAAQEVNQLRVEESTLRQENLQLRVNVKASHKHVSAICYVLARRKNHLILIIQYVMTSHQVS